VAALRRGLISVTPLSVAIGLDEFSPAMTSFLGQLAVRAQCPPTAVPTTFYGTGGWGYVEPQTMKVVAALALEAVALLASPGPRRGLKIMTRKHWALAVIAPAAVESV
jgi:hypothetical protein